MINPEVFSKISSFVVKVGNGEEVSIKFKEFESDGFPYSIQFRNNGDYSELPEAESRGRSPEAALRGLGSNWRRLAESALEEA